MSAFAEKELKGQWWQPDKKSKKFKGTLTLDESNNGTVVLSGKLKNIRELRQTALVLHGVFQDRYQYKVTVFDAGVTKPSSSTNDNETVTIELFTNVIIVGEHVRSDETPVALGARLSLTGLGAWCDRSGISGRITAANSSGASVTVAMISHTGSASSWMPIGEGKELRFVSRYKGPPVFQGLKKVEFEERDEIELRFASPVSMKDLLEEIVVWQSFLTFALRRGSVIAELRYRGKSDRGDGFSKLVLVPTQKPSSDKSVHRGAALFTRSMLGNKIYSCVSNWAQAFIQIEMAVIIFCGSAYQDSAFVHSTLLAYLQSLEVFHREKFPKDSKFPDAKTRKDTLKVLRSAVPNSLDRELQKNLKASLSYIGSLTLLERLIRLYEEHHKSVSPLFPNKSTDMKLLKDVRNFLTHYDAKPEINKNLLTSWRLVSLREKVRFFMEACLLGEIGLNDAETYDIFASSASYHYWRHEQHS